MSAPATADIAIIGGGYTGAAAAIHLARLAPRPLDIAVIDPRAELGRGIAYDTDDPSHRLNINPEIMILYLDDIGHFSRYVDGHHIEQHDPGARSADGMLYPRRSVFGDYMAAEIAAHRQSNPSRSRITHVRSRADLFTDTGSGLRVELQSGQSLSAKRLLLAASHGRPGQPAALSPELSADPRYIGDPWDNRAVEALAPDANILVLGTGLTAGDVVTSLTRRRHRGRILMLSRHGLPPQRQRDLGDVDALLARIRRPVPIFIERHGQPDRVAAVVAAVRRDIAETHATDPRADWRHEFDHVRDAGAALWRQFSDREKARYVRHLKTYYDAHRNRVAPQVMAAIESGMADGRLTIAAGRLTAATEAGAKIAARVRQRRTGNEATYHVDAIVNCTGPTHRPGLSGNPLIDGAIAAGLATADCFGLGLDVDTEGRVIDGSGRARPDIFAAGPLTRGRFGDIIAVAQITVQLQTILPALLASVD